ncbi:hypothetical protein M5K25_002078 [Dendrobium thyrsiflorum]|uniref:Uncharacterized protein n=1 Tax=Dendrobium thyrsiflorum TaxID=117978 RepID=A0ABD0W2K3_DENTH
MARFLSRLRKRSSINSSVAACLLPTMSTSLVSVDCVPASLYQSKLGKAIKRGGRIWPADEAWWWHGGANLNQTTTSIQLSGKTGNSAPTAPAAGYTNKASQAHASCCHSPLDALPVSAPAGSTGLAAAPPTERKPVCKQSFSPAICPQAQQIAPFSFLRSGLKILFKIMDGARDFQAFEAFNKENSFNKNIQPSANPIFCQQDIIDRAQSPLLVKVDSNLSPYANIHPRSTRYPWTKQPMAADKDPSVRLRMKEGDTRAASSDVEEG